MSKKVIKVYDLDSQRLYTTCDIFNVDRQIESLRNKGYSVYVDHEGDLGFDLDNESDEGKSYNEMLNDATIRNNK